MLFTPYCRPRPHRAERSLPVVRRIMIFDFSNQRKRDFDDLAACAFHLDAWSCECLSCFHAADDAADAETVNRYDLNIIFPVKRLKGRQGFCDFHVYLFPRSSDPLAELLL